MRCITGALRLTLLRVEYTGVPCVELLDETPRGTPDLVVEIVSDFSQKKDLVTLREHYFAAGIPEYWLIDARGDTVRFHVLSRAAEGYVEAAEATEPQPSRVLGRTFRIERARNRAGRWEYRLVAE